ncbi:MULTISPECIES: flavin reductase family protein [Streptomyces]|uniref:flavin reductase family protein n=1 Tax=Streptomyces TaxID=1883 RepID=UPI0006EB9991|nr:MULTISPECIES: flavin reductase family protein [Streptomyces]MCF3123111.1 flavin reductase family protein [Streptomyces arenae]
MNTPVPTTPLTGADDFRDAMALLPAALTVVTTTDDEGRRWGFTASSVVSVSLDPPLLMVGLSRTSSCRDAFLSAPEFVVNVLDDRHRALARTFARHGVDRFAGQEFAHWPGTALPVLPDAHAAYRCLRHDVVAVGDHDLLFGAFAGVNARDPGTPLLWYGRTFHTPR